MPLTILLDTSPLGTVTKQKGRSDAEECREWVRVCRRRGHQVLVPAVAYYEVARELERQNNYHGLQRLELFCLTSDCYLPHRLRVEIGGKVVGSLAQSR